MRKRIFALALLFSLFSVLGCFAATYKINTKGNVTTPEGSTVKPTTANYFNNYQSANYVSSQAVIKDPVGIIDIVMDYSGSMASWIDVAKRAMTGILSQLPDSVRIGFRTFGENTLVPASSIVGTVKKVVKNKNGYTVKTDTDQRTSGFFCDNTRQVVSVIPKSTYVLLNAMNSSEIGGATPLTYALERAAYNDFSGFSQTNKKKIILITDGGETCGGDPCKFAKELMSKRTDIIIDVVLVSSSSKSLMCVANTTGGKFYNANDPQSFVNAISDSVTNGGETKNNKQYYEYAN